LFKLLVKATGNWKSKPRNDEFWTEILVVLGIFCPETDST